MPWRDAAPDAAGGPLLPVALARLEAYDPARLREAVARLFSAVGFSPSPGLRVLVKPNLIAARNGHLSCTHPLVVRAACERLLDGGAHVRVGDSPSIGAGPAVGRKVGLADALAGLGVPLISLDRPRPLRLSFGSTIGLSAQALDNDLIVSLPKVKAHCQMRLSLAVKNLFGCVTGIRKPLAHSRFGDQGNRFESLFFEIMAALPPVIGLADGVVAMHRTGPIDGDPFPLGLLAASQSVVGLDTAVYALLGARPDSVPLWREARRRRLPGSRLDEVAFPLLRPEDFDPAGFVIPQTLRPVTFHPWRLAKGALKRACARLGK